jgi:DNA-binding MarR family transcriptional regulator
MTSATTLSRPEPAGTAHNVVTGLAKLGLALRHESWRRREESGLTPTQAEILVFLGACGQRGVRLSELADGLGVTAATASESLRALHEKGLVSKERDAGDARALAVTLTERGRRDAEREAAWPDLFLEAVGALGDEEQAVFLRGLVAMIRSLQEQGRIPVARMCVTCTFFRPDVHDDPERPHHCAFVDAPFGDRQLRLDCDDYRRSA